MKRFFLPALSLSLIFACIMLVRHQISKPPGLSARGAVHDTRGMISSARTSPRPCDWIPQQVETESPSEFNTLSATEQEALENRLRQNTEERERICSQAAIFATDDDRQRLTELESEKIEIVRKNLPPEEFANYLIESTSAGQTVRALLEPLQLPNKTLAEILEMTPHDGGVNPDALVVAVERVVGRDASQKITESINIGAESGESFAHHFGMSEKAADGLSQVLNAATGPTFKPGELESAVERFLDTGAADELMHTVDPRLPRLEGFARRFGLAEDAPERLLGCLKTIELSSEDEQQITAWNLLQEIVSYSAWPAFTKAFDLNQKNTAN